MSAFSRSLVAVADSVPVRRLVMGTRAGRALAHRFVAGETLDEAIDVARHLNRQGLVVSLDLLGEEVTEPGSVEAAISGYEECLTRMAAEGIAGNISIKLTQLGLAFNQQLTGAGLDRLATAAGELGLSVTIDMEDSGYTDATVELYEAAQRRHGNLGLALQAYLHRTPADLERLANWGGHIRLCKGAYVEPPDVALQGKHEVDAAFARLLEFLMADEGVMPAVATHDDRLIDLARSRAQRRTEPFEFQMLYGVRPRIQRELAATGHQVRIYIPYGIAWYPYLVRRLAERPANVGFFLRALISR